MRTVFTLLTLILVAANASGQARLDWEVDENFGDNMTLARAVVLSTKTTVVVGNAGAADGGLDFIVQALGRSAGKPRWTDRVASCCTESKVVVTSLDGVVFVAGYVAGSAPSSTDVVVRAYWAATGALLWESSWGTGHDNLPQAIVASPKGVVVVGYGGNTPGSPLDFIVRVYDRADGTLLWADSQNRNNADTTAWAAAVHGKRVFVAGTTTTATGRNLLVRAYDISSGDLDWELVRVATTPVQLSADQGHVFLAGLSDTHPYLAIYEPRSGSVLWEDEPPVNGIFRDVAVKHHRVVAVGSAGSGLLVRAYDESTGSLQWEDRPPVMAGDQESGNAIALNDAVVYICGSAGKDFQGSDLLVRAYHGATGQLIWDDRSHPSIVSAAVDLALGRNRLFVVGYTSGTGSDLVIRAYDIRRDGITP
jgi:hypothetical protein